MSKLTTTITTTINDYEDACYIEITPDRDAGAEEYYKALNIPVRYMYKFGKKRLYAIVPASYFEASDEKDAATKAKTLTKQLDNYRRQQARLNHEIYSHEVSSLNSILDAGYDPSLDSIDVAIKISHKIEDAPDESIQRDESETTSDANEDEDDFSGKKKVIKRVYNSDTDADNPSYICAKKVLYSKLMELVDELDGEDLEIVTAIMEGVSERELADKLNVPRSTLQGHSKKLMSRLKNSLGDFNI